MGCCAMRNELVALAEKGDTEGVKAKLLEVSICDDHHLAVTVCGA